MEIYADYRDEMDGKTAGEICGKDPMCSLWDKLTDWYLESESYYRRSWRMKSGRPRNDGGPSGGMSDEEDIFKEVLDELVYWKYPSEHFLKQEFL